jgi:hypothetical protein
MYISIGEVTSYWHDDYLPVNAKPCSLFSFFAIAITPRLSMAHPTAYLVAAKGHTLMNVQI